MTGTLRAAAVLTLSLLVSGPLQAQAALVQQAGDAIVFRGRIDGGSVARFLELLQDARIKRLVITSPGGLVAPALDMAEALHARGLDVEVPESCLSSCANYIVPAGRRKLLGGPALVGWHGNMAHVLYRQQVGEARWSNAELAGARALARREEAFFRRVGVDGFVCWFGKLAPYSVEEFYALSPADMERFGMREVTVLDPSAPPASADVRLVTVDWGTLEAIRPQVRLEE
jgi:hypothetical protein